MRTTISAAALAVLAFVGACDSDATTTPALPPPVTPVASLDGLWTASGATSTLLHFAPEQLAGSGDRTALAAITSPSGRFYRLTGLAFDTSGTLWIVSSVEARLLAFPRAALASSGAPAARTVISALDSSLVEPSSVAFDRQRRLWVANHGNGTIVRFDAAQLAASGTPAPAVVIGGFDHPATIAFDASGALWVSDIEGHTVSKLTEAQLASSGSPAPAVVLRGTNASLYFPSGIAFDAAGNLWVANGGLGTVVSFTPEQLAASGAPVPHVVISSAGSVLDIPVGLAFDGDGSLWVVSAFGELARFAPGKLTASGAPLPDARLLLGGNSLLWSAAIWPKPAGLPIN